MKKKLVIVLIIVMIVAFAGISGAYRHYQRQQENIMTIDDVQALLPAIYGVFEWQKLCDDNGIIYARADVERVKASYQTIMEHVSIDNSVSFANMAYIIGINAYIGEDNSQYISALNQYYNSEYMIYMNYLNNPMATSEALYRNSIHWNINAVNRFKKAGVDMPYDMEAGLIKYFTDHVCTDFDDETQAYLVSIAYYFWDKDKCKSIDIQPLKETFSGIYNNCLSAAREEGYQMTTADFGCHVMLQICDSLGIDVAELSELSEQWDLFSSESNWNDWNVNDLECSYLTASIYYDELSGGNEIYRKNALFCERFGSSLGLYCSDTLQPQIDSLFEQFSLEVDDINEG